MKKKKSKWMAENLKHFSFIQSDLKRKPEREHLDNVHTLWIIDDECKASRRITNDCG